MNSNLHNSKSVQISFENHPIVDAMNFLNEIIETFPDAISFASGRPNEESFNVAHFADDLAYFSEHYAKKYGIPIQDVTNKLGQYGATNGIINDLVAKSLKVDEDVNVTPDQILVTNGAQEAMAICISALFRPGYDVLLVIGPTYIGITGLCAIHNIEVVEIKETKDGVDLEYFTEVISILAAQGKVAKALYIIPDFNNPLGHSLPLSARISLLDFCSHNNLLILEDNPYGLFRFEGKKLPTLFALDRNDTVIYIGSFAKTLCPGLRLGYISSKRAVYDGETLIDVFSKVKSFLSVNTSQIAQAIAGGILLQYDCSLVKKIPALISHYRNNRDIMLASLEREFASFGKSVSWNSPEGGFFIHLKLPVNFSKAEALECARTHHVICVPVSFFSLSNKFQQDLRLSFSYIHPDMINDGIQRLARYLKCLISPKASHEKNIL